MEVISGAPSLNELILSFHAGKPYMMWIYFDDNHGEQPCAQCRLPHRSLVMTSPTTGVCDSCWERGLLELFNRHEINAFLLSLDEKKQKSSDTHK